MKQYGVTDKSNELQFLADTAKGAGAADAAVVRVADIIFRREFRDACRQNLCGKYGACWMCPPDVGDIDAMIDKAKSYRYALVFQSIGQLEDSFDIEGMEAAAQAHNRLTRKLIPLLRTDIPEPLVLGAGACHVCERCARQDNLPCRYPEEAIPSLEAHGINVSELAALGGMKYSNGTNTVTYFGGFLFR